MQVGLLDRLLKIVPPSLSRFFFANSGSEAVDNAIKVARAHTKRQNIICFEVQIPHPGSDLVLPVPPKSMHLREAGASTGTLQQYIPVLHESRSFLKSNRSAQVKFLCSPARDPTSHQESGLQEQTPPESFLAAC